MNKHLILCILDDGSIGYLYYDINSMTYTVDTTKHSLFTVEEYEDFINTIGHQIGEFYLK